MRRTVLAAAMVTVAIAANAQVSGRALVLSSDEISVNGQIFRLFGIDGIELHQDCFVDGRALACGASAIRALQTLLDPVAVTCTPTGDLAVEGQFATCTTSEGDVAENMIRQGWAMADRAQSDRYVQAEDAAREARAGAWRGTFVEPWAFREDVAAIEAAYLARSIDPLRDAIEAALQADRAGLGIFAAVPIATGVTDAAAREFRARALVPGFINAAIPDRDVFAWGAVAASVAGWRTEVINTIVAAAVDDVWAELAALPGPVVAASDATIFYAAIREAAAPLVAAGRQPVVVVPASDDPIWIRAWFVESPPEGAVISARDDAWPGYVGTIDGIDVYAGDWVSSGQAFVFPDDILTGITYQPGGDGAVVTVDAAAEEGRLIFRFARGIAWKADAVVRIEYPDDDINPYNHS